MGELKRFLRTLRRRWKRSVGHFSLRTTAAGLRRRFPDYLRSAMSGMLETLQHFLSRVRKTPVCDVVRDFHNLWAVNDRMKEKDRITALSGAEMENIHSILAKHNVASAVAYMHAAIKQLAQEYQAKVAFVRRHIHNVVEDKSK